MRYWLLKSEPDSYSIDDLERDGTTKWDGVRNYQARNYLRDEMGKGDRVLFHHSSAKPPAVVGLARIAGKAEPDPTQFDPEDHHFDPKAKRDDPPWVQVPVAFERRLARPVPIEEMRANPALADLPLLQRGQRLSVMPITKGHYDEIVKMSRRKPG